MLERNSIVKIPFSLELLRVQNEENQKQSCSVRSMYTRDETQLSVKMNGSGNNEMIKGEIKVIILHNDVER